MKNIGMTLVLTVDEAKELLVDFFTETLANDKRLLRDKIMSGQLKDAVWDAPRWSDSYIVDNVQRPRLLDDLAKKFNATTVMVALINGDHRIIWEKGESLNVEFKRGHYEFKTEESVCYPGEVTLFRRDRNGGKSNPWDNLGDFGDVKKAQLYVCDNY